MLPYTKPFLSLDDQIDLLAGRGMAVTDRERAKASLDRIGYYRLSAYWHLFRRSRLETKAATGKPIGRAEDAFVPGSKFSDAVDLYVFDKQLRLLFLDAIERIEVSVRVGMAQVLGAQDPWAHLKPQFLHGNFTKKVKRGTRRTGHDIWLEKLRTATERSSETFVKHFKAQYDDELPIWGAIELWDFGMLSTLYSGMTVEDRAAVAVRYGVSDHGLMQSWLRALNHVRNICAHHSRLWNRTLVDYPTLPRAVGEVPLLGHLVGNTHAQHHLYAAAAVTKYLLATINPTSSWGQRLAEHVATLPSVPSASLAAMGFPDRWDGLPLWQLPTSAEGSVTVTPCGEDRHPAH
jgi:abortive infection bacteriophage resistance protein